MKKILKPLLSPQNEDERLIAAWASVRQGAAVLGFCFCWDLGKCTWEFYTLGISGCGSQQNLVLHVVCLILFAITHYRFYRGDHRYIGDAYLAEKGVPGRTGRAIREELRRDLKVFIGHAALIMLLVSKVMDAFVFFAVFQLLLVYDIPWLWRRHRQLSSAADESRRNFAENLRCWLANNAWTLIVLLGFDVAYQVDPKNQALYLWLSALACFTNCIVDLVMTRDIYKSKGAWRK